MKKQKKALMLASVASMIDSFNRDNMAILSSLGYEVEVATNFECDLGIGTGKQFKEELSVKKIKMYQVPIPRSLKIKDIFLSYNLVKKIVENNNYEIIHCHSPIGGVICRLACRKVRKNGTKVIYTAHGFHFFKGASNIAWAIYYPIEKFCSRFTDVLITINQEDYERAKTFKAKRVEYVPGIGVHTEEFRNIDCINEDLRKEFGFNKCDFVFTSVGELSIRKNHEVAIKALSIIKQDKVKLLIVGCGELEEKLRILIHDLGLENKVILAGYRRDIKQLLHVVDAFAFPSLQEGLPVALMEAMASGLPVVCSKIRGNTDLIEDGVGGYLYDTCDVEGFAEGIKKIINGDSEQMGKNNIETMKKFDYKIVNEKMYKIYSEIH